EGLVGRLIIEQQSEPYYNIPMELGIYHPGEQQPEMVSFRIEGPVDTLLLEPGSMPESVVIDPFYKTLVDVIYRVETAVAPSGDIPRGEEGMEIEFYLDSTRTMREITVNYRVNGSAGDSVIVDPQSLSGGYGRAVLPPLPEGSRIEYYLKATDALGMEFLFPENAPQEYCSLGVSALPPPGQRAFVSFMLEDYRADEHLKQPDPFADYRYGLAGFDPVARENFAMLYGVGCEAAVIDRERMIYLAYNPGKQSLDLVDLGKWRLDRRIPLPAEAAPDQKHHVISYNRKLNKAYLIGFNSLWMVDLTRETVSPFQGIQPGPELNWNPSQLEFHEDLNTLLVNRGGEVFLIDTDTDEISRSFNISYQEMPHLRSESTMITLEMYPENRWYSPSSKRTGRYILNARHYRLGQEAEVIDSASCMIDFGNKILTGILGGQTVNFADELDLVIINVLQDNSNVLIWDLSGSSDTLYRFSIYPGRWRPSGVYLGKDGEAFCLVCCSSNTELLPISLNSMEIMGSGFSPFKFDNYDHPASTSCLVTGIMTLKTDLEPGDLNSDSRVDLSDLLELLEYLQDNSMPYNYLFDINRDRSIDIFDLLVLLRLLGS
ncbi:MAG: hypothetical protein JXQ83_12150, partial [Candidatus Glassbacteria bacterium]|nr:hypothetical protein [Candidatus Glassbacteria bacterium]